MNTHNWLYPETLNRVGITTLLAALLLALGGPVLAAENDNDDEELPFRNLQALDYTSMVEAGVGHISDDSIVYGGFNGLDEKGSYGFADFSIHKRDRYDGDSARYWKFTTRNVDSDARLLRGDYGQQGSYKAWFSYREMPRIEWLNENARTPYRHVSNYVIELPAAWSLDPYADNLLHDADLRYKRENFEFGLSWNLTDQWTVGAQYTHENKDGAKSRGAYAPLTLIEEPINYEEKKIQLTLAYHAPHYQSELRYEHSEFDNASLDLRIDSVQLDLAPSNSWEQISWNGAMRLGDKSRVTAALSRGTREQDDDFLPFSTNPAFDVPLPRASLDGELEVTHANLKFTTRPLRGLNLSASYTLDERDNDTPMATYDYIMVDLRPREQRINLPYEFKTSKWALKGSYRFARSFNASLGFERKELERSPFSEVEENEDDTVWAKLKWAPSPMFNTSVKLEQSDRSGTAYIYDSQHFASRPAGTTASTRRNPGMRHHNKSDRERDRVVVNATLSLTEQLDIGITADFATDDYEDLEFGLSDRDINSYNLDVHYLPMETFSLFAYASQMEVNSEQSNSGGGRWTLEMDDDSEMFGFGFEWEAIHNKLDIKLDYSYLDGDQDFNFEPPAVVDDGAGGGVFLDLPYSIERTELTLSANYHVRVDLTVRLQYQFLSYDSVDYALDGMTVDINAQSNDIIFGSTSPDDNVHGFRVTMIKRF